MRFIKINECLDNYIENAGLVTEELNESVNSSDCIDTKECAVESLNESSKAAYRPDPYDLEFYADDNNIECYLEWDMLPAEVQKQIIPLLAYSDPEDLEDAYLTFAYDSELGKAFMVQLGIFMDEKIEELFDMNYITSILKKALKSN